MYSFWCFTLSSVCFYQFISVQISFYFQIFRISILAENFLRENCVVTPCFSLGFGDYIVSYGFKMLLAKTFLVIIDWFL